VGVSRTPGKSEQIPSLKKKSKRGGERHPLGEVIPAFDPWGIGSDQRRGGGGVSAARHKRS